MLSNTSYGSGKKSVKSQGGTVYVSALWTDFSCNAEDGSCVNQLGGGRLIIRNTDSESSINVSSIKFYACLDHERLHQKVS